MKIFEKLDEIYKEIKMNIALIIVNFIWFAINTANFVLAIVGADITLTAIFGVLIGLNIFCIIAFILNQIRLKKAYSKEADRVMEIISLETHKMMKFAFGELEKAIDEELAKEKKEKDKKVEAKKKPTTGKKVENKTSLDKEQPKKKN